MVIDPNQIARAATGQAAQLTLNLFDDVTLLATTTGLQSVSSSSVIWTGQVTGMYGTVSLAIAGQIVVGNIVTAKAVYQIQYAGNGIHWVREVPPSAFPKEKELSRQRSSIPAPADVEAASNEDYAKTFGLAPPEDGSRIDVAVFYSNEALTGAGSQAAMDATIDLAILETNQSYGLSGIVQRLRLVFKGPANYAESGDLDTDVPRLQGTADGFMDSIHTTRDTVGADAVVLIVENADGCGLARDIMDPVSNAFASDAFVGVVRTCATGNYSFGHELGHLMSARHDYFVDNSNNAPFTFNHGFTNAAKTWRTIMAYNDDCEASDGTVGNKTPNCPRLQYWSNPDRTFSLSGEPAVPMGVAEGQPNAADNRKTLNRTAYTVANFRECKQGCIGNSDTFNVTAQYKASQVAPGVFWGLTSVAGGCVNRNFTIKNTANQPFTISNFAINGLDTADFSLFAGGSQVTLQPNQSRVLTLRFCPVLGLREAVLVFTGRLGNANPAPTNVLLHGVGVP